MLVKSIQKILLCLSIIFARFVSLDDLESDADLKIAINEFSKIDHLFFSVYLSILLRNLNTFV